jgi:hypothetical protein
MLWKSALIFTTGALVLLLGVCCLPNPFSSDMYFHHHSTFSEPMRRKLEHSYPSLNQTTQHDPVNVAFLGNSFTYFNDLPRFFEALSQGRVVQDSCLRGGASISGLARRGNSMLPKFKTRPAVLGKVNRHVIYDYGACTIEQLLTGRPFQRRERHKKAKWEREPDNLDPCSEDHVYASFANAFYAQHPQNWTYIVISDASDSPALAHGRKSALASLHRDYLPLIKETGARPILLWTHAYPPYGWTANALRRKGLGDVANFTSLVGAGYRAYERLLTRSLPSNQRPRVVPAALGFLTVYEERPELWWRMLDQADRIHSSPHGTYLTGLFLYGTIMGHLPPRMESVRHPALFWKEARVMQHAWEQTNPMVTMKDAEYLYEIAERVLLHGYVPPSYIEYQNGEVATEQKRKHA